MHFLLLAFLAGLAPISRAADDSTSLSPLPPFPPAVPEPSPVKITPRPQSANPHCADITVTLLDAPAGQRNTRLGDAMLPFCVRTNLQAICEEFPAQTFLGFIMAGDCSVFRCTLDENLSNHYLALVDEFGREWNLSRKTSGLFVQVVQGAPVAVGFLDGQHLLIFRQMQRKIRTGTR